MHPASESSEWCLAYFGLWASLVIIVTVVQRQSLATRCHHSSSLGARRGKC